MGTEADRDRMEALGALVASKGWRLVEAHFAGISQGLVDEVTGEGHDDRTRADVALRLRTIREVTAWPRDEATYLQTKMTKEHA